MSTQEPYRPLRGKTPLPLSDPELRHLRRRMTILSAIVLMSGALLVFGLFAWSRDTQLRTFGYVALIVGAVLVSGGLGVISYLARRYPQLSSSENDKPQS